MTEPRCAKRRRSVTTTLLSWLVGIVALGAGALTGVTVLGSDFSPAIFGSLLRIELGRAGRSREPDQASAGCMEPHLRVLEMVDRGSLTPELGIEYLEALPSTCGRA